MNVMPVPPGPDFCRMCRTSVEVMFGLVSVREANAVENVVIPHVKLELNKWITYI